MRCKYCRAKLKEGNYICPNCGEDNDEKKTKKRPKTLKVLACCLAGVILLTLLAGAIHYGLTGSVLPRENDLYYKKSYSVTLEKLNTTIGNKSFQKNRDEVVATMGEHTLTNRMLQLYYWDMVNGSEFSDLDKKKPLDQQYQDSASGKTWQQYFIEASIESWRQDVLMSQSAKQAGFEMPEKYATQFETLEKDMTTSATSNNFTSVDAMLAANLGRGATFQVYYDYLWNYYMGMLYWTEYVEAVEVDMAQIEAYYEAHKSELIVGNNKTLVTKDSGKFIDVRHILIQPKTTTGEDGKSVITDEAWETCRKEAQAILDSWLAGEHTEESFAALATEKTEDGGSKTTGGLYTDVYKGKMVAPFENWCFDASRQVGDTGLVKTDYGYHVMYFVGSEDGWIRMCRAGAKGEKANQMLDDQIMQNPVEVNYKKIVLAEIS